MRGKGINYDTGFLPGNHDSRPGFDPAVVAAEMRIIARELGCTAVRVSGAKPERLSVAAQAAAAEDLEVWFAPFPCELPAGELIDLFGECADRAEHLRRGGARVVLVDRNPVVAETAAAIAATGADAVAISADVSSAEAVEQMAAGVIDRLGGIDVLVNNAGIHRVGPVTKFSVPDWDETFAVNVRSCFLTVRALVPHMRRAGGGVIHRHTLSLRHEFDVLEVAYEQGVRAPRPVVYIEDLDGREAFVMERLEGETIGRRIVREPVPDGLPTQMAEELAKIHALPAERLPFLEAATIDRLVVELDEVGEPHPAIELGLWWLREHRPPQREPVVVHGDFRIGNLAVDEDGLVGVLDWEFAHLDDPARGGTGALIIGDVGQNRYEEIDYEPANRGGRNYGWRNREGLHDNVTSRPPAYLPLVDPIHEYDHGVGQSITGGFVYRGTALPATYRGRYFFADYVQGRVWSLGLTIDGGGEAHASDLMEHTAELRASATFGLVSSFGIDPAGELYIVSYTLGRVFKIIGPPAAPPVPGGLRIVK